MNRLFTKMFLKERDKFDEALEKQLAEEEIKIPPDWLHRRRCTVSGALDHRVFVVGDSAGAYLATYVCAMQNAPELAKAANVQPSYLDVKALGLISGMFYTCRMDKIGLSLPTYLYGEHYKRSAFYPYTNPEHPDIIQNLPPCYLITSHEDMLQRYTLDFANALRKGNAPYSLANYPKDKRLTHAFSVFHPELDASQEAIDGIYVRTMGVESAIHDDADIIMRFGFNGLLNRSINYELQYTHPTDGRNPVRNFCDGNPDSQRQNVPDNNRDLDDLCKEAILEDILQEFSGFVLLYRQMCCPESDAASDGSAYDDDTDPDGVNDNDGFDRKARPPNK